MKNQDRFRGRKQAEDLEGLTGARRPDQRAVRKDELDPLVEGIVSAILGRQEKREPLTETDTGIVEMIGGLQICIATPGFTMSRRDDGVMVGEWTYPRPFSTSKPPIVIPILPSGARYYVSIPDRSVLGPFQPSFSSVRCIIGLRPVYGAPAFAAAAKIRNVRAIAIGLP